MIPTLVRSPFHRPGWVYEEKVDGWRILAYKDGAHVRLASRNGIDHARRFPELAAAVAIFDEQLRSRFDLLRHSQMEILATPPILIAFDVLYLDGVDVTTRPLSERRQLVEDLVTGDLALPARRLAPNGLEAWAQVLERGYGGLVAKDEASPYRGGKTTAWLKVKVPGWTAPEDWWRRVHLEAPRARSKP